MHVDTDYGHPERAFFQKFEIFGLGQTNWAEKKKPTCVGSKPAPRAFHEWSC